MLRIMIAPVKPGDKPPLPSETRPKRDADKVSQEAAGYRGPDSLCEDCLHWQAPNACTVVDGDIDPKGWCGIWEQGSQEEPDEKTETKPETEENTK